MPPSIKDTPLMDDILAQKRIYDEELSRRVQLQAQQDSILGGLHAGGGLTTGVGANGIYQANVKSSYASQFVVSKITNGYVVGKNGEILANCRYCATAAEVGEYITAQLVIEGCQQ